MKTYGFKLKSRVPADGGKPKVCPRCDHWFSAQPYQRVCDGCRTNEIKTKIASKARPHPMTPGCINNAEKAQVTRSKNGVISESR